MKTLFLTLAAAIMSTTAYANSLDVYGLWLTEAKDGHVEITDCGDGTPCGRLVWIDPLKEPTERDARNRDTALQDRPLLGVPIVWDYAARRSEWRGGRIYNPEDGKTFGSSMRRLRNGTLRVKGCLGPVCITNIWTPLDPAAQATRG